MNSPSPDSGVVGKLLKMFSCQAFKAQLNLMTETLVQVGQLYVSFEAAFAVSRRFYVPSGIALTLHNYNAQRNFIQNNPVAKKYYSASSRL